MVPPMMRFVSTFENDCPEKQAEKMGWMFFRN